MGKENCELQPTAAVPQPAHHPPPAGLKEGPQCAGSPRASCAARLWGLGFRSSLWGSSLGRASRWAHPHTSAQQRWPGCPWNTGCGLNRDWCHCHLWSPQPWLQHGLEATGRPHGAVTAPFPFSLRFWGQVLLPAQPPSGCPSAPSQANTVLALKGGRGVEGRWEGHGGSAH